MGGGGSNFGGYKINKPLYADDIVIVSPTSVALQHMITNLENIAEFGILKLMWKSKNLSFQTLGEGGGSKLSKSNKWWYLDVTFTPNPSWELYFKEKGRSAKFAVHFVLN